MGLGLMPQMASGLWSSTLYSASAMGRKEVYFEAHYLLCFFSLFSPAFLLGPFRSPDCFLLSFFPSPPPSSLPLFCKHLFPFLRTLSLFLSRSTSSGLLVHLPLSSLPLPSLSQVLSPEAAHPLPNVVSVKHQNHQLCWKQTVSANNFIVSRHSGGEKNGATQ